MPYLVAPRALKAATKVPSWRHNTTMSGSDSSRWCRTWGTGGLPRSPRAAPEEPGAPPRGTRGGNRFQVARPEQPALPVRKAHVYGHVLLAPVALHYRADHAASLGDPVVPAHPHPRADAGFSGDHVACLPLQLSSRTLDFSQR